MWMTWFRNPKCIILNTQSNNKVYYRLGAFMCVLVKNRDILNELSLIQSLEDRIAFKKLDEVY